MAVSTNTNSWRSVCCVPLVLVSGLTSTGLAKRSVCVGAEVGDVAVGDMAALSTDTAISADACRESVPAVAVVACAELVCEGDAVCDEPSSQLREESLPPTVPVE